MMIQVTHGIVYREWEQLPVHVLQGIAQTADDLQVWHCPQRAGECQFNSIKKTLIIPQGAILVWVGS